MNIVDTLRGMATALDSLFVWQFLIIGVPCLLLVGLVLVAEEVSRRLPSRPHRGPAPDRPYDWEAEGL